MKNLTPEQIANLIEILNYFKHDGHIDRDLYDDESEEKPFITREEYFELLEDLQSMI